MDTYSPSLLLPSLPLSLCLSLSPAEKIGEPKDEAMHMYMYTYAVHHTHTKCIQTTNLYTLT